MKIFLIHGFAGSPDENWFPWLKEKLELDGVEVIIPEFPTPENQSLDSWLKVWQDYKHLVDEETIFVGHSLGPAFILNILQDIQIQIKASFFVAPFINRVGVTEVDDMNESFFAKNFDYEKIKSNCKEFYIYYSDNDPYIPAEESLLVNKNVDGEWYEINNAGHFNSDAGYNKFEKLYNQIKEEIVNDVEIGAKYIHKSGKEYKVLDIATHSETQEKMVVYKALYGKQGTWVRPLIMFCETLDEDGIKIRRFRNVTK